MWGWRRKILFLSKWLTNVVVFYYYWPNSNPLFLFFFLVHSNPLFLVLVVLHFKDFFPNVRFIIEGNYHIIIVDYSFEWSAIHDFNVLYVFCFAFILLTWIFFLLCWQLILHVYGLWIGKISIYLLVYIKISFMGSTYVFVDIFLKVLVLFIPS
jgi:hypothetical protein